MNFFFKSESPCSFPLSAHEKSAFEGPAPADLITQQEQARSAALPTSPPPLPPFAFAESAVAAPSAPCHLVARLYPVRRFPPARSQPASGRRPLCSAVSRPPARFSPRWQSPRPPGGQPQPSGRQAARQPAGQAVSWSRVLCSAPPIYFFLTRRTMTSTASWPRCSAE